MLYPLKFKPLYKDYVWGGRNLQLFGKTIPDEGIVAESWEVACHKNGTSIIANGEYEGVPLSVLIERLGRLLIGTSIPQKDVDKFPLLVKFIDAQNNLSVQVHPDDAFANKYENGEYGKNEMWYIVSAKPGSKLVYDVVPGTTRDKFAEAITENNVESLLKSIEVFAGDVIDIPAGLVHAIGKGIILAEIQQNSDATYRVYDYGRIGRQLHVEKALKVIDFASEGRREKWAGIRLALGAGCTKRVVTANRYFCTEIYDINGDVSEHADGSKFAIYVFTSGNGTIHWGHDGQRFEIPAAAGESVLIPAAMGNYILSGSFTALKTYLPDIEADILKPLLSAGNSLDLIVSNIGGLSSALHSK